MEFIYSCGAYRSTAQLWTQWAWKSRLRTVHSQVHVEIALLRVDFVTRLLLYCVSSFFLFFSSSFFFYFGYFLRWNNITTSDYCFKWCKYMQPETFRVSRRDPRCAHFRYYVAMRLRHSSERWSFVSFYQAISIFGFADDFCTSAHYDNDNDAVPIELVLRPNICT